VATSGYNRHNRFSEEIVVATRDVRVTRLIAEVEQERQLRLKAEQRASGLKSANQRLQSTVLKLKETGDGFGNKGSRLTPTCLVLRRSSGSCWWSRMRKSSRKRSTLSPLPSLLAELPPEAQRSGGKVVKCVSRDPTDTAPLASATVKEINGCMEDNDTP
jgi:hypothetical protein